MYFRTSREYAQALRALQELRRENAALREPQRRPREGPARHRAVAREDLGLIRADEIPFGVKVVKRDGGR